MKNKSKEKSNLDEMQELKLLKIEHNGCWIAFWGLVAAIFIQQVIFGNDFKNIVGECLILIVLSVYITASCIKNGIWDRKLKANSKTNFTVSLVGGLVVGTFWFIISYKNFHSLIGSIATFFVMLLLTLVLCFILLSIFSAIYRKKKQKMENDDEDME